MAKLCDLGIAKAVVKENDIVKGLQTDVGTYLYKAPELFELGDDSTKTYNMTVDLFSLGLLISAFVDVKDKEEIKDPES